jgi:hypothetical protein
MKEKRVAHRKDTELIYVNDLTCVDDYNVIAKFGQIVNASSSGFLLEVSRTDIVPQDLRSTLNLENIVGQQVVLYLPQMNLDLDGKICRANHVGKGKFVIAVEFSPEVPEYWRECLIELLPAQGEMVG